MKISEDIIYIGVKDEKIDLFEGQYKVPEGMTYNSYLIADERVAVMDTADKNFTDEWLENLKKALGDRQPTYLIVHHMEPDHSASIKAFLELYPGTTVVASQKAFSMIEHFFEGKICKNILVVKDGDTLSLGKHVLNFVTAPMIHWPEVIMTYDSADEVLFSADAFGKFGSTELDENWENEARRYYIGIVGKYGVQVQNLFKKVGKFKISTICPLHGPVLKDNLEKYLSLYQTWSTYKAEKSGVLLAYTSIYGNTKKAAELLFEKLKENGCEDVVMCDLARSDMSNAVALAFAYEKLALATTTYNGEIFPFMKEFIDNLTERNYQNRTVAMIENGSWAPQAVKVMKGMFEKSKNITFCENSVSVLSAMNEENRLQIEKLAKELSQKD